MNLLIITLTSMLLFSCSIFKNKNSKLILPNSLEEAAASSFREEINIDRDEYQHPVETLKFFGIKPEMTVVEIFPGAGYYSEILAPYLAHHGLYVIAVPRMPSNPPAFMVENEQKLQEILLRHETIQSKAKFIPFEPLTAKNRTKPAFADMVVSFNSVHNWVATGSTTMAFKFFNDILKPGGILGLTQHRISERKKNIPKSGYMTEKSVIALAQRAGFRLIAKSEINANLKDTANYPDGVWTLPPFYRLGEKDRDKYEDIGESDRMTLRFVKIR